MIKKNSRGGCGRGRGGGSWGVEGVGLFYHSPYRFMMLLLLLFSVVAVVLLVIAAAVAM